MDDEPNDKRYTAVLPLPGGRILVGRMSRGLVMLPDFEGFSKRTRPDALDSDDVRDLAFDPVGQIVWVAADGGFSQLNLDSGEWRKEYPPTNGAVRVKLDPFGRPYVATYGKDGQRGGAYCLDGNQWRTIDTGKANSVYDFAFGKKGWAYDESYMFIATDMGIIPGKVPTSISVT